MLYYIHQWYKLPPPFWYARSEARTRNYMISVPDILASGDQTAFQIWNLTKGHLRIYPSGCLRRPKLGNLSSIAQVTLARLIHCLQFSSKGLL
ncbi:hypothetical protein CPB83DRAFT_226159 [Crepidotus variabilis]|uniref:Uncharacterized protein n=1 Tax=Crepidotus variabilis TaxID=179855 RepID=A0A9P6JWU3_9AGAR|nr:hypothetical protein CPB83DRAFT_226159 [Crepidotus variabilis]